jgi:hypothetical protein
VTYVVLNNQAQRDNIWEFTIIFFFHWDPKRASDTKGFTPCFPRTPPAEINNVTNNVTKMFPTCLFSSNIIKKGQTMVCIPGLINRVRPGVKPNRGQAD